MGAIVRAYYEAKFDGYVRPDHGRMISGETGKPGYGLYDRALSLLLTSAPRSKESREVDPVSLNMSGWEIEAGLGIRAM
jgi:hypothetical protein